MQQGIKASQVPFGLQSSSKTKTRKAKCGCLNHFKHRVFGEKNHI